MIVLSAVQSSTPTKVYSTIQIMQWRIQAVPEGLRQPIVTARKRSLRRLCFYRCLSFILFTGGGRAWQGGVRGRGGVHGRGGACVAGGGVRGRGGMCGRGGAWQGGACVAGGHAWRGGHAWFYSAGGACVVLFGGHAWFYSGGACVVLFGGGVRGFIWGGMRGFIQGGVRGFIRGGACVVFSVFPDTMRYGQ